jgi:hypothetical protein
MKITLEAVDEAIADWVSGNAAASRTKGAGQVLEGHVDGYAVAVAGDPAGTIARIEHLRHVVADETVPRLDRWRAEDLEIVLGRLEQRARLVRAGVLSPSDLR